MSLLIKSISTNSGFLQNVKVDFSPNLTCIIGARGTCKSTLVETIRFVFDSDRTRVAALVANSGGTESENRGIIAATLGAGTARCIVTYSEKDEPIQYSIEREIGSEPRLHRDEVREHTKRDLLHKIEIYSQSELQLIASDDQQPLRLRLIDRPNIEKVEGLRTARATRVEDLRKIGPQLRQLRFEAAQNATSIRELAALRSQLAELRGARPELSENLQAQHRAYQERQKTVTSLRECAELAGQLGNQLSTAFSIATRLHSSAGSLLNDASRLPESATALLARELAHISQLTDTAQQLNWAAFNEAVMISEQHFESENEPYYALRKEQQAVNESLKREESIRRQIDHLEQIQRRQEQIESQLEELHANRKNARADIAEFSDQIYRLRLAEVDAVNASHGEVVLLTLEPGAQSLDYSRSLQQLLAGSRIRGQVDIARELCQQIAPSELIDIVEGGDAGALAGSLDRDIGQMTRLVAYLADQPDLYSLEGAIFEDRLEITMYDDGQPKRVESLSKGQRATALLPLILREADYPLIFDQPEDDLDNSFIFKSLVQVIRKLKLTRQLIFVTHNANIPVLGEADEVIVMHMHSPSLAASPKVGTIDERKLEILELLEGGPQAFEERKRRYATLLEE